MSSPSREEVTQQLQKVLGHHLFRASERLTAFLRFVVEKDLAGQSTQIKEYVIGVEVFGKPDSYSPQEEPVVRIMAGRLRSRLAEYYLEAGRRDPVLIELPRGGYVPRYRPRSAQEPTRPEPAPLKRVGRGAELAVLATALRSAQQGAATVVAVGGEAGIGKTTLIEEFLAGVAPGEAWVARGRGSERLQRADALVPMFECLDSLRRGHHGVEASELILHLAPTWAQAGARSTSTEQMRRELVAVLEALSRDRPVVLFLDDMHWADSSTCDLLAHLGALLGRVRLLLALAYRPVAMSREHPFNLVRRDLERRGIWRDLELGSLSRAEVAQFVGLQFPDNRFGTGFLDLVNERTQGNPLFLVELLRHLRDRGAVVRHEAGWSMAQPLDDVRKAIPEGVRDMIRVELDRLDEVDRRVLLCASVQGLEFDSVVVAGVLGLDAGDVEERLQALDHLHRVVRLAGERELPNGNLSLRCRFAHVLFQNVLYSELAPSRRAALSRATGDALSSLHGARATSIAAELALLYQTARDHDNAARWFLQAARNASRVFAHAEAAELCRLGLASLATLPELPDRDSRELTLTLTLGLASMGARGYGASELKVLHTRASELGRRLNDARRWFPALVGLHTYHVTRSELADALEVGRELEELAATARLDSILVESLHANGTTLAFMGRCAEAKGMLGRIVSMIDAGKPTFQAGLYLLDRNVTSLSMYARLIGYMGLIDEAHARAREAFDLAVTLGHPQTQAYAELWVGHALQLRGDWGEAMGWLERAMRQAKEHGLPQIHEWSRVVRGSVLARVGRREEGIAEMRASMDRQLELGSLIERAYCFTVLAEAVGGQEAIDLCDRALEFGAATGGRCFEPETHRVRGEAMLGCGERERARADFDAAVELARESGALLLEQRALAARAKLEVQP